MSSIFKALADPTRRHVLQLLREGPKSAGDLADHVPVSKPTMSAQDVLRGRLVVCLVGITPVG